MLLAQLWAAGATVRAYDPEAAKEAAHVFGTREDLAICDEPFAALEGADALVIMTEEQSRTLPLWLRGFVQASASRETDWGQVMAASTLVAVPVIIFFLIVQGRMSSGLVGGAVKG